MFLYDIKGLIRCLIWTGIILGPYLEHQFLICHVQPTLWQMVVPVNAEDQYHRFEIPFCRCSGISGRHSSAQCLRLCTTMWSVRDEKANP